MPKCFWCAPHFSLVPPTWGGTTIVCYDWETIEVSPSVGSSVCTSTGEIERGAMKVMGPSAVPCRLVGYWKLTTLCGSRQSYNACPCPCTVCSALKMKLTLKIRRYFWLKDGAAFFKSGGHSHIGPPKQKSQGARAPPVPTPMGGW